MTPAGVDVRLGFSSHAVERFRERVRSPSVVESWQSRLRGSLIGLAGTLLSIWRFWRSLTSSFLWPSESPRREFVATTCLGSRMHQRAGED